MTGSTLGYSKDLFVLPFDHRGSFESGLLGIRNRKPTPQEVDQLTSYKRIIYEAFLKSIGDGVPADKAAILVDQKYGEEFLVDARRRGMITCAPVEKSGQAEFDFEYGDDFGRRLREAAPTFAKVLVRYNPEDDKEINENQRQRLKVLSDFTHSEGYRFMFELLVPATTEQLESVGKDKRTYDLRIRPELTVRTMEELQAAGIEPDVWKLEGIEDPEAAQSIAAQARAGNRSGVGVIVLGRGEDETRVRSWLTIGAQTEGVIGFAVGRTVFWQSLVDHKEGVITRVEAAERIAQTYQGLYRLFIDARAGAASQRRTGV